MFTAAKTKHKLVFKQLSEEMHHLETVTKWAEDEWGYINNKGLDYRRNAFKNHSNTVYLGFFSDIPVAMFVLMNKRFSPEFFRQGRALPSVSELRYVYVEEPYRHLGFGVQIVNEAKRLAAERHSEMIVLDTFKPRLNHFYEKQGGNVIAENSVYGKPTDVLRIKI